MITAAVIVAVAGFSLGIGYIWGSRTATNNITKELEQDDTLQLLDSSSFVRDDPLPQGFNPRTDGGKELDDALPLVQVEPTYYQYDEDGEATGEINDPS